MSRSATSPCRRSRRGSPFGPPSTRCPQGSSRSWTHGCASTGSADRLDEVLEELTTIRARMRLASARVADRAGARLAGALARPRGAALALVVDELRDLVEGRYGTPPGRDRPDGAARGATARTTESTSRRSRPTSSRSCARRRKGSPRARRSCSCWPSSARTPSRCSARCARAAGVTSRRPPAWRLAKRSGCARSSGSSRNPAIGEVTIEEGEMRVTVRRTDERADLAVVPVAVPTAPEHEEPEGADRAAARRHHPRRVADGRDVLPRARTGRRRRSSRRATRSRPGRRCASSRR